MRAGPASKGSKMKGTTVHLGKPTGKTTVLFGRLEWRIGRYVGKCGTCGKGTAADVNEVWTARPTPTDWFSHVGNVNGTWRTLTTDDAFVVACACGGKARILKVKATITAHICDARCMGATGPRCECSCGGENHGSANLGIPSLQLVF